MKTTLILTPVFIIALVMAGCGLSAQPLTEERSIPVRAAEVVRESRPVPIRTIGKLEPKTSTRLSFKVSGRIQSILVDEGHRVSSGQVLARLDLSEIDAHRRQAQIALEKARRDHDRIGSLYSDSVATYEQLQNAFSALELAESAIQIAEFNRKYAIITAPAEGRILRRIHEPNEIIGSGQPVLTFGGSGTWVVRTGISDRDVAKLRLGDLAEIDLDALSGKKFAGSVTQIAEQADPGTGTFEVEITLKDPDSAFKSGFIARIDLFPLRTDMFSLIPVEALVKADGHSGLVFELAADGTTARRRDIQIAYIRGDSIAVSGGLETVKRVITDGSAYVTDGATVEISR